MEYIALQRYSHFANLYTERYNGDSKYDVLRLDSVFDKKAPIIFQLY